MLWAALALFACDPGGAERDGGMDAGGDASDDAGFDARPPDAADAGVDPCMGMYAPCTADRGCRDGECFFTRVERGYCVPAIPTESAPRPCRLGERGGPCGACGLCVGAGTSAGGERLTVCLRSCERSLVDNGDCMDDYECDLGIEACVPGCIPGSAGDTACGGTCDSESFRCHHDGTTGAEAGDVCTDDTDCEEDGRCIVDAAGWPGGYCTRDGCDLPGGACTGEGGCIERRVGAPICLATCTVASGGGAGPAEWITDRGGCREGYACNWDGLGGPTDAPNGSCLPGNFNALDAPNVGATCSANADCYSPFGLGYCSVVSGDGYCTIGDCGAPGIPGGICGDGASCVDADGTGGDFTVCLSDCAAPDDCSPDVGCAPFPTRTSPTLCIGCTEDAHCRSDHRCDADPGFFGPCVPR